MAQFGQAGRADAAAQGDKRLKKHINTPEGRYVLREEGCYNYPYGYALPCSHRSQLSFVAVPQRGTPDSQGLPVPGHIASEGAAFSYSVSSSYHHSFLGPESMAERTGAQLEGPVSAASLGSRKAHKSRRMPFTFFRSGGRSVDRDKAKDKGSDPGAPSPMQPQPRSSFRRPLPFVGVDRACIACNIHKEVRLYDYANAKKKDNRIPFDTLYFETLPTSHEFNQMKSQDQLELLIGLYTGELVLYDTVSKKRRIFNAANVITSSPVTCVRWVPGTDDTFISAHEDGCMYVYCTDRGDPPQQPGEKDIGKVPFNGFSVFHPKTKHNPLSRWRLGKGAVTEFSFSPDCKHVAIVSRDGCLRLVDFREERLLVTLKGYFGALLCVTWSPDGLYILTGGEDDLVSIWSFEDRALVARGEGHGSWVVSVDFDPWASDDCTYRFGSVGLDQRLLLWDFGANTIIKPKQPRSLGAQYQMVDNATPVPPLPRLQVPTLEPISNNIAHPAPLSGIIFRDDAVLTACQSAQIRVWSRPALQRIETPPRHLVPRPDHLDSYCSTEDEGPTQPHEFLPVSITVDPPGMFETDECRQEYEDKIRESLRFTENAAASEVIAKTIKANVGNEHRHTFEQVSAVKFSVDSGVRNSADLELGRPCNDEESNPMSDNLGGEKEKTASIIPLGDPIEISQPKPLAAPASTGHVRKWSLPVEIRVGSDDTAKGNSDLVGSGEIGRLNDADRAIEPYDRTQSLPVITDEQDN